MVMISPIPLALLGIEETRQMGVGYLRNFASLVLSYASLAFVLNMYPTLLSIAMETSWQAGGVSEMVLSVTAASSLQVLLVTRSAT